MATPRPKPAAKKKPETTGLATQFPIIQNYLALKAESGKVTEIIKANLQGQTLTPFDLDRVTVPTGGGTTFEVPTLDGSEPTKTMQGILVHFTTPRAYWAHGLDESNGASPPDCSSSDGLVGVGRYNGQQCEYCPMNQWGSGHNERGKACKEKRMLFMLQPNSYIPLVIQVPTMSIGPLKQYMMRLASRGLGYWSVVTELTLEVAQQSGGGLKYSRIVPRVAKDGMLTEQESERVKEVAASLRAVLTHYSPAPQPDAEDFGLPDEEPEYLNDEGEAYSQPF